MWQDPIVEEVRKTREAHAQKFNYDLKAIFQDIKKREKESGNNFITFCPEKVKIVKSA